MAEVARQKDIDSSGNDVSANSQSAEVQDLLGGIAALGRHRKRSFTQIDPSRRRWQPPVQERQAWHDRQLS